MFEARLSSKSTPVDYWRQASSSLWAAEMAGHRNILERLGNVRAEDVRGMRAPFLQGGGNTQFSMMAEHGFIYDMSMPTQQNDPPLWPYTLDYRSTQGCDIPPCPTASFPGVWEVPLVDWLDTNGTLCSMVDGCHIPESKDEALQLLHDNFNRHYHGNRAPFPVNLRARWFYEYGYNREAITEWLDSLASMNDVYVVTVSQMLSYVRNPVAHRGVADVAAFSCDALPDVEISCEVNSCVYENITHAPNSDEHPGERRVQTCNACPETYPWLAA
ncbi:PREDICTED: uncharacterized protein LOC106809057 [Priapulus caudatus]|uniref:Uncharacterized protein LOC106809057 n=1 Tax=Priapulus caudatus TaxID=37621 RepID=A0ABM1E5L8_PRICU|nr:PREDICTED: uncharacterized protein LOC106809057 [Priapulus caudatus]